MYDAAPNNLTPPPSIDFPAGYDLVVWVQMRDFIRLQIHTSWGFGGSKTIGWIVTAGSPACVPALVK